MQNWIGGPTTRRAARCTCPAPELVPAYMEDLIAFLRRDDLPAVAQAAIAHAQFESVHPFTDGNGRIGRALIGAVWRRRGLTPTLVVPVASAMLADTGEYFARVNAYRDGRAAQFVRYLATSASLAAQEARISADNLADLPALWRAEVRPRAGSAAAAILDALLDHPVLDGDLARQVAGRRGGRIRGAGPPDGGRGPRADLDVAAARGVGRDRGAGRDRRPHEAAAGGLSGPRSARRRHAAPDGQK
ncbi:Fic family protein [Oerskovia sp. M15]